MHAKTTVTAITEGIKVSVESRYIPEQSRVTASHYVFAYHIRIENKSAETVQLKTRSWVVTDALGEIREVKGQGVIGVQPLLRSGQVFEYTSGCVLPTQRGTMHGTYHMHRDNGTSFDVVIPMFLLEMPHSLN